MSLKDRFDKFIDYFTEDGEDAGVQTPELPPRASSQSVTPTKERTVHTASSSVQSSTRSGANENITRLHARQQELAQHRTISDDKVTINVIVNIEDLKLPDDLQSGEFDFDMKRR